MIILYYNYISWNEWNLMINDVNDWKQSIIINDHLIGGKLRDDDRVWGQKGRIGQRGMSKAEGRNGGDQSKMNYMFKLCCYIQNKWILMHSNTIKSF